MNDNIELLINGIIYSGWQGVRVRRSLDFFASSFDLSLTDTQAGMARTIKTDSPCRLRIGGETIITGFIDRVRPRYDGRSRSLTVSGRSKTADLVDCSLPAHKLQGAQKKDRNLLELARSLCDLLHIEAGTTTLDLPNRAISNIEPGQTFYEYLESQARIDGVMLVDDPDGNLTITRAGKTRIDTALVLGENIEGADGEFSARNRFSHYYVDAQDTAGDDGWGEATSHISGLAEDTDIRNRPTSILLSKNNLAEVKKYAEWQRNIQYGRSRKAVYTVSGWRHKDGLWKPNTNVLVNDDWMGFTGRDGKGEWLMIGTVEYIMDHGGKRTGLTVMPVEAYDLIPLPAEDTSGDDSW